MDEIKAKLKNLESQLSYPLPDTDNGINPLSTMNLPGP